MRKWIALLLVLMLALPALTVMAAQDGPIITLQPQSPNYPQYSVAVYTVKAEGTNLSATWYLTWEGKTYEASAIGGAMQPWEAYAGEAYGAMQPDANTFTFVFEGIGQELNGAELWCVIEDGHYDVTSQKAYIQVGNAATPPEILQMPAGLTVEQGGEAELRCIARSGGEAQLSFLWYETPTGELKDITALDRGAETSDFLICDTGKVGVRYYVCCVSSTEGGMTYSSVVPVTVTEPALPPTQPQETEPAATQPATTETTAAATTAATEAAPAATEAEPAPEATSGLPWWVTVLVAVVAAGAGVGVAVVLMKKK